MQHEEMLAMLDKSADMVIKCDDGRLLPACTFLVVSKCKAIQHVVEDTELPKDDAGRLVVPFPNVPVKELSLALHLVHGVTDGKEWAAECVGAALRGLDALYVCDHTYRLALSKFWWKAQDHWVLIEPFLDRLVHCVSLRGEVLRHLVVKFPSWPEFRDKVLMAFRYDYDIAAELMNLFGTFFPIGPMYSFLMGRIPHTDRNVERAMEVFTKSSSAAFYCHPPDVNEVLEAVIETHQICVEGVLADETRESAATRFLHKIQCGLWGFGHVPSVPMGGSVLQGDYMVSVMLGVFDKTRGTRGRRITPWLKMFIDFSNGTVDAQVMLRKLRDARFASNVQVRLTAYGEDDACADVWYSLEDVVHNAAFSLMGEGAFVAGDQEAFRGLVRSSGLGWLRFDMFYGHMSVFEKYFI